MEPSDIETDFTDDNLESIRLLLFGDAERDFPPSWTGQGFIFKVFPPYGLAQLRSGPCGVIASVAAHVLDEFIYGSTRTVSKEGLLRPTYKERQKALSKALSSIIWRARSGCQAVVLGKLAIEKEKIKLRIFTDEDSLYRHIQSNIRMFMKRGGICLFICSLLLTRGIETIRSDMDFPDKLIGEDSYASQELVNLIITGHAVTNLFNGDEEFNSETDSENLVLKGITKQSRIGFLSLSEYYDYDKVGSFLKDPENPIWVLNGDNHYFVLFGTSREVLKNIEEEFHLWYVDNLFSSKEICLKINPRKGPPRNAANLPATLKCLLTRWPSAKIDVEFTSKYE